MHSKIFEDIKKVNSYADLYRQILTTYSNPTALNYFQDGDWKNISSEDMVGTIRHLALGLRYLGLKRGDTVGLMAPTTPRWVMIDFAIILAGGVTVPFFNNISESNFAFQTQDAATKFFIIEGHEDYEQNKAELAKVNTIIRLDELESIEIEENGKEQRILDWEGILTVGKQIELNGPGHFDEVLNEIEASDLATIIYTSGSTGVPKGVELSHSNLISQVRGALERMRSVGTLERALTCLPTAHVFERMIVTYYVSSDISCYFTDDITQVADRAKSVRPQIMTMVPRLLEKIYEKMISKVKSASFIQSSIGKFAFGIAFRNKDFIRDTMLPIMDAVVYKKLRSALGGELKCLISGGAPLNPSLAKFFSNVGVPIYQGYGLTEASPVIACNYPGASKIGSVGPAFPGVEVKLTDDGEVICKGPNVMLGYHNSPEATAKVLKDGWLYTGDRGKIDEDGFLTITGRIKEFLKTSNGKYISPIPIEQALCKSLLVEMAMVVAEGKKYPSCLLFLSQDELKKRKEKLKSRFKSMDDFLSSESIKNEIEELINKVNRKLNRWEQIQKFELVPHPISVETGELTPTMKIKRFAVSDKYQELIDSMYQDSGELL